jgi:two-component system, LytTR family, sensor kinase
MIIKGNLSPAWPLLKSMTTEVEESSPNSSYTKPVTLPKWLRWLIGFGVWTSLAVLLSVRGLLYYYRKGGELPWAEVISASFIDFYLWGAVSPLIFILCRRFPIERGKVAQRIFLHLFLGFTFAFAILQLSLLCYWYFGYPNAEYYPSLAAVFKKSVFDPYLLHQNILVYWMTLLAAHTVRYYRQLRVREMQTARLSEQLAQAQLNALKMQVHPHFLFNTLNAISALLDTDVKAADRMIARLSDFLRMTLKSSDAPATTLERELEFLRTYLEIEKIRFQDKLAVEINVEPQVLDAVVPNLILQPLVENAVRHGIARQTITGRVRIAAQRYENRLLIEIEDNGPGLKSEKSTNGQPQEKGLGLANTQARLEHFYGRDFHFEISEKADSRGTLVKLNVPFIFEKTGNK